MSLISRRNTLGVMAGTGVCASLPGADAHGGISGPAKCIVQVFLSGGPSHIDTFDPKPHAPREFRSDFDVISTSLPGIQYCQHLPELAGLAHKACLLRGFAHTITDHTLGCHYVLTGDRSTNREAPLAGSVIAQQSGWQVPPPFIAIDRTVSGPGVLGAQWRPLELGGDCKNSLYEGVDPNDPTSLRDFHSRRSLLDALNRSYRSEHDLQTDPVGYQASESRARDLATSGSFRTAINPDLEPVAVIERYGKTRTGRRLLTARRLVEAGSRFISVQSTGWDTHFANFSRLKKLLPELDQGLSALIRDLDERGLLSSTAVLVYGEFGRTPRIDPGKTPGRGHWAKAGFALCYGGMFKQGHVYGATDQHAAEPVDGRVTPEDLAQTIFHLSGADPSLVKLTAGRKLAATGRVLTEILEA